MKTTQHTQNSTQKTIVIRIILTTKKESLITYIDGADIIYWVNLLIILLMVLNLLKQLNSKILQYFNNYLSF